MPFQLQSSYQPTGDQPQAIAELTRSVQEGNRHQVLLGVTGSGKTFTMANVIQNTQKPTLVIAHNKTLAAQLYQEFRDFFPNNAVSYFVSYYDYYQPEAYIPASDTYIEKESQINDEIDKLRLAATTNLLTRKDVIVVASVSCIYNLGSPIEYGQYVLQIMEGELISRESLLLQLANLQYERANPDFKRGTFRVVGDTIQIWPAYQDMAYKIDTLEDRITSIREIDPISGTPTSEFKSKDAQIDNSGYRHLIIYPAKHYVINPQSQNEAIAQIEHDLTIRSQELKDHKKLLEAYRLEQKVRYDIEMIKEFGFVNGIENYSRYFDGRKPGDPPFTLIDYFQANQQKFGFDSFLTIIDESHMSVPQIRGMFNGDQSRKLNLINYGFRLPSALDNRPLQFPEFLDKTQQLLYVSATPNDWEIKQAEGKVVEQLIRPTGLVDPLIKLKPTGRQIEDLVIEVIIRKQQGQRVLVTTLTKRMAEALTEYLNDRDKINALVAHYLAEQATQKENPDPDTIWRNEEYLPIDKIEVGPISQEFYSTNNLSQRLDRELGLSQIVQSPSAATKELIPQTNMEYPKVAYLHSDIETLERSDILDSLRKGEYDVLVGINLLREGLDLPEVSLVAILDADKEGFLRSATSMIQTMGRAARHLEGTTILYADRMTFSMKIAIEETQRRRQTQTAYNQAHGIQPQSINKPIRERLLEKEEQPEESSRSSKRSASKQAEKTNFIVQLTKSESIDLSELDIQDMTPADRKRLEAKLSRRMKQAAHDLDFELAAQLRDYLKGLEA